MRYKVKQTNLSKLKKYIIETLKKEEIKNKKNE
jgi:hypothetical protein